MQNKNGTEKTSHRTVWVEYKNEKVYATWKFLILPLVIEITGVSSISSAGARFWAFACAAASSLCLRTRRLRRWMRIALASFTSKAMIFFSLINPTMSSTTAANSKTVKIISESAIVKSSLNETFVLTGFIIAGEHSFVNTNVRYFSNFFCSSASYHNICCISMVNTTTNRIFANKNLFDFGRIVKKRIRNEQNLFAKRLFTHWMMLTLRKTDNIIVLK